MQLGPDQDPRAILCGKLAARRIRVIVLCNTALQIVRLADVETAMRILKDVDPELTCGVWQAPPQGLEP